ncbi:MAG: ABC transporter substrate-binding protein [Dongiaceae bacterium]
MRFSRSAIYIVLIAILAALFILWPKREDTPPLNGQQKVTVAQFGKERFLLYLPFYIAMEEGIFKKNGLDVELTFAGNDDQIFAAVIGGSAQFGMGDPVFAAIAKEKNGPGKVVAMMITKLGLSGYTNNPNISEIKAPQDLQNLRVSTFPKPSTTYTIMTELIAKNNLNTQLIEAAFGAQMATLESGKVDIAVDIEPTVSIAESKGYRVVLSMAPFMEPQAITGITTTETVIQKNPDTVQRLVSSLQEALTVLHTQPDVARNVAQRLFPNLGKEVIDAAYKRMIKEAMYPQHVLIDDILWQRTLKTRLDSGELKTPQATDLAVDNRFAERAAAEAAAKQPR